MRFLEIGDDFAVNVSAIHTVCYTENKLGIAAGSNCLYQYTFELSNSEKLTEFMQGVYHCLLDDLANDDKPFVDVEEISDRLEKLVGVRVTNEICMLVENRKEE